MSSWKQKVETYYGNDEDLHELLVVGIEAAIEAHHRIQRKLDSIDHRGTKNNLPDLAESLGAAADMLSSISPDSRGLLYFYIADSLETNEEEVKREFEELERLTSRWRQMSELLHDHLRSNVHFRGENNPSTIARQSLLKALFLVYRSAFQLDRFPTIYDRNFKRIVIAVLEELELRVTGMSELYKETLRLLEQQENKFSD